MKDFNFKWDNRAFQFFILGILALVWGSSFLLMKKGLQGMHHTELAAWRLVFALIFLFVAGFGSWRKIRKAHLLPLLVVGLFGNGFPAILFSKAITHLDSSVAGVLNSMVPLFTMLVGLTLFRIRIRWYNVVGILIGFGGALILFSRELSGGDLGELKYAALPVLAALCYAISLNTIKFKLKELSSVAITVMGLGIVGPPAGLYLGLIKNPSWSTNPAFWNSLGYVALLGIFGTAISLLIFNKLVKFTSPLFASSVTYLIPVVAMLLGMLDGEILGFIHFVGMAVILTGVYLVNKKVV